MSDPTHKLVDNILERLDQKEQERIEAVASQSDREQQEREKRVSIEVQLAETGQQLRQRILEHRALRYSRKARWFGGQVIALSIDQDPPLKVTFGRIAEILRATKDKDLREKLMGGTDLNRQTTLTTPLLLIQPLTSGDQYRFETGWKFQLKQGPHNPNRYEEPKYGWDRSPLYIFKGVREVYSGEEASELAYIMAFQGDMDLAQKEHRLSSYADGNRDDELVMAGKDAHLHALGLMQGALEELSFKRKR